MVRPAPADGAALPPNLSISTHARVFGGVPTSFVIHFLNPNLWIFLSCCSLCAAADFRGQDLSEEAAAAMRTTAVQFAKGRMQGTDFTEANCRGVSFFGAYLKDAIFHDADLSYTNMGQANLTVCAAGRGGRCARAGQRAARVGGERRRMTRQSLVPMGVETPFGLEKDLVLTEWYILATFLMPLKYVLLGCRCAKTLKQLCLGTVI